MCNVKSGVQIKNRQDVQNLIIGIIFRQTAPYKIDDIINIVVHCMKNSLYHVSEDDLYYIVSDTLDMLYIRNRIKCKNGVYSSLPFKIITSQPQIVYN